MARLRKHVGERFGHWTVIEYVGSSRWMCLCDCGAVRDVAGKVLRRGISTHCGCQHPSPEERFWSYVYIDTVGSGCWEWFGTKNKRPSMPAYGVFSLTHGKPVRAHRFAWESVHGPIPAHMDVLHRCDNPPCVRPDHLFLGTHADNMADRDAKGRTARGERGANKLTGAQVLAIRALRYGGRTQRDVGLEFNVSDVTVSLLWRGITWRHLLLPEAV